MNIRKNSIMMLGLVFGVSVIFYILDIPMNSNTLPNTSATILTPTSIQIPTVTIPISSSSAAKQMSAAVDYSVRRFPEHITVNLTLQGLLVTNLQITQNAGNGESAAYQDAFATEIKPYVVGKNINDINVSRVAGASYTSDAFMQAIISIRSKI